MLSATCSSQPTFSPKCSRSRAMTEPFQSNKNGRPAVCDRSLPEDDNTKDSENSMTFDHKQPTNFTKAFNLRKDLDATPKRQKKDFIPRRILHNITNLCQNHSVNADSPVSRQSTLKHRKRQNSFLPSRNLACISTPQDSIHKRGRFEGSPTPINRTQSESVLEVHRSPSMTLRVEYSLAAVLKPQQHSEAYRSISGECLAELMGSMSEKSFLEKYIVIDCRYPYEYEGGHVKGAINVYDTLELQKFFFDAERNAIHSRIPIFYCEYSQKRGPSMALQLRNLDRNINDYPQLDYQEIYLLDRGYKKLYEVDKLLSICEPQSYTAMDNPAFQSDLRKNKNHIKGSRKGRSRFAGRCPGTKIPIQKIREEDSAPFKSTLEKLPGIFKPLVELGLHENRE
ncbi:hypothetical protein L596_009702 [Steinernema carpocapsae]|uniref:M-phase inducer phosphatase n=1 Tax=Steinernema carpocapsae TaxID=34508 RepID=A0A4U5PGF6_STECR|nr:hypothetical protein L596_009702 [Steinernema carpocapsae]